MNKIFLHIEFKIDKNDKVEIIEINPSNKLYWTEKINFTIESMLSSISLT